jgi:hypothetical protein
MPVDAAVPALVFRNGCSSARFKIPMYAAVPNFGFRVYAAFPGTKLIIFYLFYLFILFLFFL